MSTKKNSAGDAIRATEIGAFVTLQKIVPSGALQARKLKSGTVALYWRYTLDGKTDRVVIGNYDSSRPPKSLTPEDRRYSIAAAVAAAQDLAQKHAGARADGGHRALVAAEKALTASAYTARIEAGKQTLERLALAYCDHLQAIGRNAHREARCIFNLHVIAAWPEIAKIAAAEVTDEQIADMLRRLFDLKKGRTANKLRAYLRAAFEVARRAKTDPKVPVAFKAFGARSNPAAATTANADENRADKNPLSANQMRTYWRVIEALPGQKGALLRLHLMTGGQRIEQLLRLRAADVTKDTITLFDGKGRPGKPARPHALPLLPNAADALKIAMFGERTARKNTDESHAMGNAPAREFALSTDGGKTHISNTSLSKWAVDAVGDSIPGFKTKRLRSGIETLLASAGISKDVRGRLQSHGISGVQANHYDAHDYLPEKKRALETLLKVLTKKQVSNVVSIESAA